ncbi:MAG TPA: TetR/AcrR family transcriptional regulator [Anaerolineae bacterium]|nr:TetR/AcrR family transcriptional regulator [Anaerolineae bacterium]
MKSTNKQTTPSASRRQQILDATLAQFSQHGLTNTTIAAISQRSGASVGSIYHHFGDREGILYALYHQSFAACFATLTAAVLAETTAEAGVRALVTTYLDWIATHEDNGRFIYEASGRDLLLNHQDQILAFKNAFYTDIMTWLQPHIAAGHIIPLPPWAYDVIIMGPAHEFARRWLAGLRPMPLPTAQTIIADAIWRAIHA